MILVFVMNRSLEIYSPHDACDGDPEHLSKSPMLLVLLEFPFNLNTQSHSPSDHIRIVGRVLPVDGPRDFLTCHGRDDFSCCYNCSQSYAHGVSTTPLVVRADF